jgi:rhodanese-related sulfurtransferase
MKKTFKEAFTILILSIVIGFIANAISPKGIALIRDDSERFTIDTAKANKVDLKKIRGKLDKGGFYQPVNIPVETAKELFDEGALFVDGRIPAEYQQGHIKGAMNIDYKIFKDKTKEEKQEIMKDIKKEQVIVSYCSSDSCEISIDNAYEMAKAGYDDIKIYLGGYKEWNKLGYPTDK